MKDEISQDLFDIIKGMKPDSMTWEEWFNAISSNTLTLQTTDSEKTKEFVINLLKENPKISLEEFEATVLTFDNLTNNSDGKSSYKVAESFGCRMVSEQFVRWKIRG